MVLLFCCYANTILETCFFLYIFYNDRPLDRKTRALISSYSNVFMNSDASRIGMAMDGIEELDGNASGPLSFHSSYGSYGPIPRSSTNSDSASVSASVAASASNSLPASAKASVSVSPSGYYSSSFSPSETGAPSSFTSTSVFSNSFCTLSAPLPASSASHSSSSSSYFDPESDMNIPMLERRARWRRLSRKSVPESCVNSILIAY